MIFAVFGCAEIAEITVADIVLVRSGQVQVVHVIILMGSYSFVQWLIEAFERKLSGCDSGHANPRVGWALTSRLVFVQVHRYTCRFSM